MNFKLLVLHLIFLFLLASCGKSPFSSNDFKNKSKKRNNILARTESINKDISTNYYFIKGPSLLEENEFTLNLFSSNNYNFSIEARLWMPSMGHGSYPIKISKIANSFTLTEIYFIMPGDWELQIKIFDGTKLLKELTLEFDLI